jgi:hypothetical protein
LSFFFFGACVSFCSHLEGEDEHVALDAKQGNNKQQEERGNTYPHPPLPGANRLVFFSGLMYAFFFSCALGTTPITAALCAKGFFDGAVPIRNHIEL